MARKPDAKRERLGLRVHEETLKRLQRRHAVEASTKTQPARSLSETTELLLLFALSEMPRGWRP